MRGQRFVEQADTETVEKSEYRSISMGSALRSLGK